MSDQSKPTGEPLSDHDMDSASIPVPLQPEPTGEEVIGDTEAGFSDMMYDQPKPAAEGMPGGYGKPWRVPTGEWTAMKLIGILGHKPHGPDFHRCAQLINAALDAEFKRGKLEGVFASPNDDEVNYVRDLEQQLDAERQDFDKLHAKAVAWQDEALQLREQLDAERERIRVLESGTGINAVIETNKQLRAQLAAAISDARAESEVIVDALKNVRKGLCNGGGPRDAVDRIDAARAKVKEGKWLKLEEAPLVDALIKIANDPDCDRCQVAVNELAKVNEGK